MIGGGEEEHSVVPDWAGRQGLEAGRGENTCTHGDRRPGVVEEAAAWMAILFLLTGGVQMAWKCCGDYARQLPQQGLTLGFC